MKQRAVALQYKDATEIPSVLASGTGDLAKIIIDIARQHQIPVHEDAPLSQVLARLPVGSTISPETFSLVAEAICFLFETDKEWQKEHEFLLPILTQST